MTQGEMFGEYLKAKGIADAEQGAGSDWMNAAMKALYVVANMEGVTFTTDQIWEALEAHFPDAVVTEPRAMGAVMTKARKQGLITATGIYIKSTRPKCHARPVMVWRRS